MDPRNRSLISVPVVFACLAGTLGVQDTGAREVRAMVKDARGAPVADAVVYVPDSLGVPVVVPAEPYILDQVNKEFLPHILPVVVGSEVRFPNRDNIHHHVYSFSRPRKFELQLYKGEPAAPVRFDKTGIVKVGCNIHSWMSAIIVVLPNAFFAVTGDSGEAVLRGLPDNTELTLQVFHERLRQPSENTIQAIPAAGGDGTSGVQGGPAATATMTWQVELKPERKRDRPSYGY